MADSSADRDPLERLAEEFVTRFRAGERPSLTEYERRLPERAAEVRDLFPALVEMEQLKPVTADQTGAYSPGGGTDPTQVGEFRILRRVGVGGMGVVYEAVQESLGRHVALKLLPTEALADAKRMERFRREAKAAAKLHHTNIVPVFGTGEADGRHFYAMQFIAGHPLDAVIDEVRSLKEKSAVNAPRAVSEIAVNMMTGTFDAPNDEASRGRKSPVESNSQAPGAYAPGSLSGSISDGGRHYFGTVARIGAQVADALSYAHAQGVLHRDIKPANLLLDLQGTVWVTDFGLAKETEAENLTQVGDIVGTLRYMAPERFDGAGDHRADVYALGLTLYELLTLKPAFHAENRAKLVEQVVAAAPKGPRSINPAIPKDFETIVLKAIQRDPAMRYQSAGELADDLKRYREDRPIQARRAGKAEQAWRWCRRNPSVAGLLATVLVVLGAGVGLSTYFAVAATASAVRADAESLRAGEQAEEADKRAKEADGQRRRAGEETQKARDEQEKSRQSLVQLSVTAGLRAAETDPFIALLWYERAWQLDRDRPEREPSHRLRIASLLERLPELVGCCFHTGEIRDADMSADGTRIVSYTGANLAYLWDPARSRLACPPLSHTATVSAVGFGPRGDLVVTVAGNTVRLWEGRTGTPTKSIEMPEPAVGFAFRPDGKRLAIAAGGLVRIYNPDSGLSIGDPLPTANGPKVDLAYSQDGTKLAVAGDGIARVWNPETAEPVTAQFPHERPKLQRHGVSPPAFTPDGKGIVAATADSFAVHSLVERSPPRLLPREGGSSYSYSLCPNGLWAAQCSTYSPEVYDILSGRRIRLPGHPRQIFRAEFSPDGLHLVTVTGGAVTRVWKKEVDQFVQMGPPLKGGWAPYALRFSIDGRRLMIADRDGTAKVWDLYPKREPLPPYSPAPGELRPLWPPGQEVAKMDGVGAWKLEGDSRRYWALNRQTGVRSTLNGNLLGTITEYDTSPDGPRLATSHTTGDVRIWDPSTGMPVAPPMAHVNDLAGIRFSPNGRWLATVTYSNRSTGKRESQVWDVETGELLLAPAEMSIVGFTPDGNGLIAKSEDGYVLHALPRFDLDLVLLAPLARLLACRQLYGHLGVDSIPINTFIDEPAVHRKAWLAWRGIADDPSAQPMAKKQISISEDAIDSEAAARSVGRKVTVEMVVGSVGQSRNGDWLYLNSRSGPNNPHNFSLSISGATPEKRKEMGLEPPNERLTGKRVRANGEVTLYRGNPQIVIERVSQIRLLEP